MTRYDLTRMGPQEFQRLSQALLLAEFGSHIQIHGLGPDGGRDASTRSDLTISRNNAPWTGYTVIQVKHKEELTRRTLDAQWVLKELRNEVSHWLKREEKPDQLLVMTNVILTPAPGGGEELINEYLHSVAPSLGLKEWDVWHAEKICRLLDVHTSVRQKYMGAVVGDLLSTLTELLTGDQNDIADAISGHLARVFKSEKYAELDQGGGVDDRKVPLARVFVDIPYGDTNSDEEFLFDEEDASRSASTATIIEQADRTTTPTDRAQDPQRGRIVVIGGPGQGKSTLGRFVCQIYRAELLDRHEHLRHQPEIRMEVQRTRTICREEGIPLPTALRFPVFVSLPKFANYLATNRSGSLLSFIAERIGGGATLRGLRLWLRTYPWLLVLDGLDEVPSTANRGTVMDAISTFHDSADACGADIAVLATSRPQGYKEEFANYFLMRLTSLTQNQALRYSQRLTTIRHGEGSEKSQEIMQRVKKAALQTETARLMTTPLQVTILVLLLSRSSRAPSQRFVLFDNYYQVIYARELEKDTPHVEVLDRFRTFIDLLHWRVGLRLQNDAAKASHTEASLSRTELSLELEGILQDEGYEEHDRSELVSQIMNAATERLVFLVANTSEEIGFELRSLQEFCAAKGLLEGSDDQVYSRLATIACSDHWRNTFLLASGAIFCSNSARRDMIVTICSALNSGDVEQFPGTNGPLMGSRLAVDILVDRVADTAPRHQRLLTDIVLAAIRLAAPNPLVTLARVDFTDKTSASKVKDALSRALSSSDLFSRLGALLTLSAKADLGSIDDLELMRSHLQHESVEAKHIFLQSVSSVAGPAVSLSRLLISEILEWPPELVNLATLTRGYHSLRSNSEETDQVPISPSTRMMLGLTRVPSSSYVLDGVERQAMRIRMIRGPEQKSPLSDTTVAYATVAGDMGPWEFLRKSILFTDDPSPSTWKSATDALRIADGDLVAKWWTALPWPLAIWWERDRPSLEVTSETISHWQEAQRAWFDLDVEQVGETPPQISPRVSGVPTVALSISQKDLSPEMLLRIFSRVSRWPRDRFRDGLLSWWWGAVGNLRNGVEDVFLSFSNDVWEESVECALSVPSNLIVQLSVTDHPELVQLADKLGKSAPRMGIDQRTPRMQSVLVPRAYMTWERNPEYWGIGRALMRYPHSHTAVHRKWGDVEELDDEPTNIYRKLSVAWGGSWDEDEVEAIAYYLYRHAKGQETVPIGFFAKFIDGCGGAELISRLTATNDERLRTVVNNLARRHASRVVPLPELTIRTNPDNSKRQ
ncbi:hypothetical protein [Streptomyces sp. NPDC051994]|uniref:NACHT domain-containing protein n=1 Tax=unclassified Streptomyces TaxID=2593676 RepID=UPI00341353DF